MESALKGNTRSPGVDAVSWFPKIRTFIPVLERAIFRLTHWETWDWRIKYFLIAPVWFWYCLKARSLWFFTAANPTLTFGGFDGENKREMYEHLPAGSYPESVYASRNQSCTAVEEMVRRQGLELPLAVKPQVGKMGLMFRKITSWADLQAYHQNIPCDYIIQPFISYPLELSVFYYRMPGAEKGTITGFIRKDFLEVTGDGKSTLWQLMSRYPRVQFRLDEMKAKHKKTLQHVIPAGEKYVLSPALNLSRGGRLVSLSHLKDDRLLAVFDKLSHSTGTFFYGRYDIKCLSIEDLKKAKNFSVLEYNGSGAEPHHVYGNGYNLFQACGIIASHWQKLYRISRINHKKGVPYWDFERGRKFFTEATKHIRALKDADRETELI